MNRKSTIVVILVAILLLIACSCSHNYYSGYNGKVTKGFRKPPRELKGTPIKNHSFRAGRAQRNR